MTKSSDTINFFAVIPTDDPNVTLEVPIEKCPEELKTVKNGEKFTFSYFSYKTLLKKEDL